MHGRAAVGEKRSQPGCERRPITIGLLWHSLNSGNLGVGALTVANLTIARRVAEESGLAPRFIIMGARDTQQALIALPDSETVPIDWRALRPGGAVWRAMGQVDCVLDIGAGYEVDNNNRWSALLPVLSIVLTAFLWAIIFFA